mmetsp:Transcript_20691/g.42234  ORF Transcript_20691/g.42234 Transcript_20691/m.42234 type:complete len:150 (+) Transcript_20691:135-584(+)
MFVVTRALSISPFLCIRASHFLPSYVSMRSPGHVCSDDPGFAFRCKLDPSSTNGGSTDGSTVPAPTPGATVVAPPPTKSPTFPAAAPPSDVGLLMTPTSEPTLEPTQEPTKDGELGFGSANGAAATATAFVGYTTLVLGALLAWTAIAQ